jgi:hypothetical protein
MLGSLTGLIVIVVIFGVPGIWLLGKTEIGHALIERLRHGAPAGTDAQLLAEFDEMKEQLAEVQDRLEFTERQLAALKPGADRTSRK